MAPVQAVPHWAGRAPGRSDAAENVQVGRVRSASLSGSADAMRVVRYTPPIGASSCLFPPSTNKPPPSPNLSGRTLPLSQVVIDSASTINLIRKAKHWKTAQTRAFTARFSGSDSLGPPDSFRVYSSSRLLLAPPPRASTWPLPSPFSAFILSGLPTRRPDQDVFPGAAYDRRDSRGYEEGC
jgi:hypothetical protein